MAKDRTDRIRDGVANTGGVSPGDITFTDKERKRNRRERNQRARAFNQKQRQKAREVNANRRARAERINAERFKSPDIASNETYQRELGGAIDRKNQTLAGLDDQQRQLGVSYGLGQMGGSFTNNPYSRAALLQRSYDQNQRRTINSMAGAGQLYSGATQGAANFNRFNFGQSSDALQKDFGARTSQIDLQRQSANDQFGRAEEAAMRKSVATTGAENPVNRENAPQKFKPKVFKPRFMKIRPPINRPKGPGPTGGVRP
jgi:hypothetical protein